MIKKAKYFSLVFIILSLILILNLSLVKVPHSQFSIILNLRTSDSTAWLNPSTASNEARAGSGGSWSNWDYSKSQSDSYADVSLGKGAYSDNLRVVDFGFSLSESTINGIEVEMDKYASNSLIQDYSVQLVKSGSVVGDDNAKTGVAWATSDTDTYTLYGGSTDTWNSGLTYLDINDNTFGVQISAINTKTGSPATYIAYIDHIRIKVYYTLGGDSDAPTWDTLTESADPLELGNTETININVYDVSTITDVDLEFDGSNHSMGFISGNNYRYSTWTPITVGIKEYNIWMTDEFNNINNTGVQTLTVQDTVNPSISNIVESADPLELGNTETIQCDITDESDMEFVYLEIGGVNETMSFVSGITWEYTAWTPTSTGNYPYTIYANDTSGNIDYDDTGDITVQDTVNPSISNIVESADPLELGNTETIQCDITDESDMEFVYLEIGGVNETMSFVSGITWEYTAWTPTSTGNYPYIIYANDTSGNMNSDSTGSITVQDTVNPIIDNVIESADPLLLGNNETIQCDITDESDMEFVYLEFEGSNHSMSFVSGIKWEYTKWKPTSTGNYPYIIYANDTSGNIAEYNGDITVSDIVDNNAPTWDNLVEINDPLELGKNITIRINVYDETNISNVYIEINNVNYSMTNISNTYSYSNWLPLTVGIKEYQIWLIDYYNNIANIKGFILVQNTPYIILSLCVLFSLMIIMTIIYLKLRVFLAVLVMFLFSLIIGVISLIEYVIPFSPYLQVLFLLFQTSIFIITSMEGYNQIKK